jgi:alpha-L-fucosidase 2
MAIHPLGLIRWEDGPEARRIIRSTIDRLDSAGPSGWCGYSYAWLANLKARARDGEGAARALTIFAKAFCSPNSFHLNGDQTNSGYSSSTYRPFTLEGNFAFAAGVQEMLLQSNGGAIDVFPAVPPGWADAEFTTLRAEGAFLVSAQRQSGKTELVRIVSRHPGTARLRNPFEEWHTDSISQADVKRVGPLLVIRFNGAGEVTIRRGQGNKGRAGRMHR